MMRLKLVLFAAVALAGIARPAAAIEYPWCAQYSGDDTGGGRNCGFSTHDQCRATVSGFGGFCEPNLFYLELASDTSNSKRKRQR